MLQRHALEKKRLPRIQKSEMKTRAQLYKQSLRISQIGPPENDRDKIRQVRGRHAIFGGFEICILDFKFCITKKNLNG